MNKRRLHHFWTKARKVKPTYLLIITLLCGAVCTLALRSNNEHMVKLRSNVYTADKAGTDVEAPLRQLQSYVTSHMNTSLTTGNNSVYPPIQLKYTYQRLLQAESATAGASNTQLYTEAQNYCQAQIPTGFSGRGRVPCIEQYIESHDTTLPQVPTALYEFDFVSPKWSPDLAGWSLLATIIFGLLFVVSLPLNLWLKSKTRH